MPIGAIRDERPLTDADFEPVRVGITRAEHAALPYANQSRMPSFLDDDQPSRHGLRRPEARLSPAPHAGAIPSAMQAVIR